MSNVDRSVSLRQVVFRSVYLLPFSEPFGGEETPRVIVSFGQKQTDQTWSVKEGSEGLTTTDTDYVRSGES